MAGPESRRETPPLGTAKSAASKILALARGSTRRPADSRQIGRLDARKIKPANGRCRAPCRPCGYDPGRGGSPDTLTQVKSCGPLIADAYSNHAYSCENRTVMCRYCRCDGCRQAVSG